MDVFFLGAVSFLLLFFLLLVVGLPVAFSLGIAGFVGIWMGWDMDIALNYLQMTPYRQAAHYTLAAIPLYLLMGRFIHHGGLSTAMFTLAYKWFGRLPGGLAMATCMASAGFAALTGSTSATVAAIAPISIPEMDRFKYSKKLTLGVIGASGTFAIMIPPSITFIIYGLLTETSIAKLFIAGILPGIISAFIYLGLIVIRCKMNPNLAPLAPKDLVRWKDRFYAFKGIWHMFFLILLVLGGIYSGIMTVNEAGAIGAIGAFFVSLATGKLNFASFRESIKQAVSVSSMIFIVIIGAFIFGYFLSLGRIPQSMISWVGALEVSRWTILTLILAIYVLLGTFMDQVAIQVLTLPITFPLVTTLGFDPIWFGVIVVKTTEIGLITPPLGLNVYILKGVTNEPLETIFASVAPFLIADFLTLTILVMYPAISLYLPSLMG